MSLSFETVDKPAVFVEEDTAPVDLDSLCAYPGCNADRAKGSGRGRKPIYCEDHKKKGGAAPRLAKDTSNDRLANDAAAALAFANSTVAVILQGFGMQFTGQALEGANDQFRANAMQALKHNPALCKKILDLGNKAGSMSLVAAYGMLAVNIAPVAVLEIKSRRESGGDGE